MHALLIGILVAATAAVLFFAGARVWARTPDQPSSPPAVTQPAAAKPAEAAKPLTREEIGRRLKLLATEPAPKIIDSSGAKCYRSGEPEKTAHYLCPIDNQRTYYPLGSPEYRAIRELRSINFAIKEIPGMELLLGESELCKKCYPGVKGPKLILFVKIQGSNSDHRVRGVTYDDIKLIREFASGQKVHKGDYDSETPLKDYLPRLQELLGVTILK